jgi:hypothetical protein
MGEELILLSSRCKFFSKLFSFQIERNMAFAPSIRPASAYHAHAPRPSSTYQRLPSRGDMRPASGSRGTPMLRPASAVYCGAYASNEPVIRPSGTYRPPSQQKIKPYATVRLSRPPSSRPLSPPVAHVPKAYSRPVSVSAKPSMLVEEQPEYLTSWRNPFSTTYLKQSAVHPSLDKPETNGPPRCRPMSAAFMKSQPPMSWMAVKDPENDTVAALIAPYEDPHLRMVFAEQDPGPPQFLKGWEMRGEFSAANIMSR